MARSPSKSETTLLLDGEDDDCEAEATNAPKVKEMYLRTKHDVHLHDNTSHLGIVGGIGLDQAKRKKEE